MKRKAAIFILVLALLLSSMRSMIPTMAEEVMVENTPTTESDEKIDKEYDGPLISDDLEKSDVIDHRSTNVYYVRKDGNDTNDGSLEAPFATLGYAVRIAASGSTIFVLSDLEVDKIIYIWNKDITIKSEEGKRYTLKRSEEFNPNSDARGSYNPAMIEVGGTPGSMLSTLRLEDIILDDANRKEGEYFIQAASTYDDGQASGSTIFGNDKIANSKIVQDAIIATYNNTGTIILGQGTTLKNYGGMSAVRVSGGKLIMEDGSSIVDDMPIDRTKGTKIKHDGDTENFESYYGPAGAIWVQGGEIQIDNGAFIGGVDEDTLMEGRAFYIDGGSVSVDGEIANIVGSNDMWYGANGIIMHLRNSADGVLEANAHIRNIQTQQAASENNVLFYSLSCDFKALSGSLIEECTNVVIYRIDDLNSNYAHAADLDCTIRNCKTTWSLFTTWYGQINFGTDFLITDCEANGAGGLIYSNNGTKYIFDGTIENNTALSGMIYIANQSGGRPYLEINKNAVIANNEGLGVKVNNGSKCIMNGGTISNNTGNGVVISGKDNWKGVEFIMIDGTISNNREYGIYYSIGGQSTCNLKGGVISGNSIADIGINTEKVSDAYGSDSYDNLKLSDEVLKYGISVEIKRNNSENKALGTVYIDDESNISNISISNDAVEQSIEEKVKSESERKKWSAPDYDPYWMIPTDDEVHFEVTRGQGIDTTKGLYLAYIKVSDDGTTTVDDLKIMEVRNEELIDVDIEGLEQGQAYAFMFVNNDVYTLKPDDITLYPTSYDGDTDISELIPEVTIDDCFGEIKPVTINGKKLEGMTDSEIRARIIELFDVEYEKIAVREYEDHVFGQYKVYFTGNDSLKIKVGDNEVDWEGHYGIINIRAGSHDKETRVLTAGYSDFLSIGEEMTGDYPHGLLIASEGASYYLNGDKDKKLSKTNIELFHDGAYGTGAGLIDHINDQLDMSDNSQYAYDFHYLDLVDANNANAWITTDSVTVYLPFPEAAKDIQSLRVVYFSGLDREYTGDPNEFPLENDYDVIEMIDIDKVEMNGNDYIRFDAPNGNLGMFGIIWETDEIIDDGKDDHDKDTIPDKSGSDLPKTDAECAEMFGDDYIYSDEYDACVIKYMIVDTGTRDRSTGNN